MSEEPFVEETARAVGAISSQSNHQTNHIIMDNVYTLEVSIRKTNTTTGSVEHEASVVSRNLTLAETIDMQEPLLTVIGGWVKQDAE